MRIERYYDRRAISSVGMSSRGGNDRLMPAMNAVENTDGEEEGAGKGGEIGYGMERLQA